MYRNMGIQLFRGVRGLTFVGMYAKKKRALRAKGGGVYI